MYKVYEAGTGTQITGYVIPSLFDPRQGGPTPQMLFTNGGQFALQGGIVGDLVAVSHNLPMQEGEPRGLGIFYRTDGRTLTATIPFQIITKMTVQGQSYYAAQTMDGLEVQITPSEGLRMPVAVSPKEIAIPAEFTWLPLNNQIQLEGDAGAGVMAQAKTAAAPTMVEIRAWRNEKGPGGGCHLSGPVFDKVGAVDCDWVDGAFWLACAGMPQNVTEGVFDKAASTGEPLRLYGLRPLSPEPLVEGPTEAEKHAAAEYAKLIPQPVDMLREALVIGHDKEARTLVGVDSIDNLLSLNFINEENVGTFVDYLPELEDSASKLAELVFASQMGLQGVSKTAAARAMKSLDTVIQGLKSLKTYSM